MGACYSSIWICFPLLCYEIGFIHTVCFICSHIADYYSNPNPRRNGIYIDGIGSKIAPNSTSHNFKFATIIDFLSTTFSTDCENSIFHRIMPGHTSNLFMFINMAHVRYHTVWVEDTINLTHKNIFWEKSSFSIPTVVNNYPPIFTQFLCLINIYPVI